MLGLQFSSYVQPRSHIHMHTYSHTCAPLSHTCAHTHTLLSPKGLLQPFSSRPGRIEKPNSWFHEGPSGSHPMPCSLSLYHPRPTSNDKCLGILVVKLLSFLPKQCIRLGSSLENSLLHRVLGMRKGIEHVSSSKIKTRTMVSALSFPLGWHMDDSLGSRAF